MALEPFTVADPAWQEAVDVLRTQLDTEDRWELELALGAAARSEIGTIVQEWASKRRDVLHDDRVALVQEPASRSLERGGA